MLDAFKTEKVTEETAMNFCVNKSQMRKDIDYAKKEMFPESNEPSGLKLNLEDLHVDPSSTFRPLV